MAGRNFFDRIDENILVIHSKEIQSRVAIFPNQTILYSNFKALLTDQQGD
jgi:hypothetical protein